MSTKQDASKKKTWFTRFLISVFALLLVIISIYTISSNFPKQVNTKSRIQGENFQQGSPSWRSSQLATAILASNRESIIDTDELAPTKKGGSAITAIGTQMDSWTDTTIRGYAGSTSVNAGDSINLYVSTGQSTYNMEVYRMGWYGGSGGRLLKSISGLAGQNQPVPTPQSGTGLIEANWQSTYNLRTDSAWLSGVYLVKLIAADNSVGYVIFVLRNDGIAADIVYQIPFNTYQAYNSWGGKSLYDYNSTNGRAFKVSYDRPYEADGTGFFFNGDYNMIRWLESNNYNVTYAASNDTLTNSHLLDNRKIFMSTYHDEYWSKDMRDNLTGMLNQGKDLAFFSANNIYWQVRFENSTVTGTPDRVMTCYKDISLDPQQSNLATVNWRDAPVSQPENALLGVMYESQLGGGNSVPWIVTNSNNWVYNGTGLKNGDHIDSLVGYEYDKVWNNGLTPAGLVSLSSSPLVDAYGTSGTANGSVYQAASGAFVFSAGTIYWDWKLDDNDYQHHGRDWRVQRMTSNILGTMISGSLLALAPSPTVPPPNAAGNYTIYGDALASGWSDWSWGSKNNLNDSAHTYAGTRDISWTPSAWGGLSLINTSGVGTTGYLYLTFAVEASQANESASVNVLDGSGYGLNALPLARYGGNPAKGSYKKYTIPLIDLGVYNSTITGFQLTDQIGKNQPAMYIDSITLDTGVAVTPTITPTLTATATPTPTIAVTPTSTIVVTPSPTATVGPINGYAIYSSGLTGGWQNWSWSSTVNLSDTSHPYNGGTLDIAWTPTAAYAGLYIANPSGVSTGGYTTLTFAIEASQANESASVSLIDTSYNILATLPLSSYGGNPVQGSYKVYTITLANLNAVNKNISAVQISNQTSSAQPTMYLDKIYLAS